MNEALQLGERVLAGDRRDHLRNSRIVDHLTGIGVSHEALPAG
jgi:hypothetical protein